MGNAHRNIERIKNKREIISNDLEERKELNLMQLVTETKKNWK